MATALDNSYFTIVVMTDRSLRSTRCIAIALAALSTALSGNVSFASGR